MSFPVIIIFLVLCLWFVICLPLLGFYYLEGKLGKVYDMVILLSLCVSMVMTFIIVTVVVLVYYGVMLWLKLHSNSVQHVYLSKDGKGWVHKESELSLVDEQYIEWFKNSVYYDKKNTSVFETSG